MRDVVVVSAARTPIGRGHSEKGAFRDVHPNVLLGAVYEAVIERAGIDAAAVEEVVAGAVNQVGEQSANIARNAWLQAGPADGALRARAAGAERGDDRRRWEIPRAEMDELGLRSHRLAHRATDEGRFEREIVPIPVDGHAVVADQGIRPDTTLEQMAALRPAFKPGGKVTAGNASQISDGAAAVLLMARETAEALGVRPMARIADQTTVGVDPVTMLTGPIPATRRLLERNGMTVRDVDLFEVNEAFSSVVAAWQRELEPDMDRVNVNGGALALGHPLGSSGARLITTLVHEMERADREYGLVTMCTAGGTGTGTLLQRV